MKKLLCMLVAMSLMLSLAPAMGEGLVKGPPTPPPYSRNEDGVVVVDTGRTPVVVTPVSTPTPRPGKPVAVNPDEPVLSGGAMVDMGGVLMVDIVSASDFARAKESPITLTANVSGGQKPYTLSLTVKNDGVEVHSVTSTVSSAGAWVFTYQPVIGGKHVLEVSVTDATGEEKADETTVSVSENAAEGKNIWKKSVSGAKLTGDWRKDLVAIAQTQIGYRESSVDFIVDEEGVKRGYTRYGDWYGSMYGEWCSTFIAFCCEYANIPKGLFPRAALVGDLMDKLDDMGAGEDYRYLPMAGDIVFFSTEGDYAPEHVGIVENVSGSSIYTIEGNSSNQVRRREYALNADEIVGYGNVTALMKQAGLIAEKEAQTIVIPDEAIGVGYTMKADVNMRVQPSSESAFVKRISDKGSEVSILMADESTAETWYFVQYKDNLGYVRGDLLQVTLLSTAQAMGLSMDELNAWISEVNPTDEMITRAQAAGGLDMLVLEGEYLIYVRTGKPMASYNSQTGLITDMETGLVVAMLDAATGAITPAVPQ